MTLLEKTLVPNYKVVKPELIARQHTDEHTLWYKIAIDPNEPDNLFYIAKVAIGEEIATAVMVNNYILGVKGYPINDILAYAKKGNGINFPEVEGLIYLNKRKSKDYLLVPAESYWAMDNLPIVIGTIK